MARLGHNNGPALTPDDIAELQGAKPNEGISRRALFAVGIVAAVAGFEMWDIFLDGNLYTELEYFNFRASTENLMNNAGYSSPEKIDYLQNKISKINHDINISEKYLNGRGDFELTKSEADWAKSDLKEDKKELQMLERLLQKYSR